MDERAEALRVIINHVLKVGVQPGSVSITPSDGQTFESLRAAVCYNAEKCSFHNM
ncbi:MAG UNVERIFIED_CONTAM: hypothetical protein LVQ98_06765 [Rickettsiaceae bacterium]